jgi:hypothetical protein
MFYLEPKTVCHQHSHVAHKWSMAITQMEDSLKLFKEIRYVDRRKEDRRST